MHYVIMYLSMAMGCVVVYHALCHYVFIYGYGLCCSLSCIMSLCIYLWLWVVLYFIMHSQINLIHSDSAFCCTRIFTVHGIYIYIFIYDLLTCNSCLSTPICKRFSVTCKGLRHWQCYRQAAAQVAARLKPSSQLRSWNSYEMRTC